MNVEKVGRRLPVLEDVAGVERTRKPVDAAKLSSSPVVEGLAVRAAFDDMPFRSGVMESRSVRTMTRRSLRFDRPLQ